MKYKNISIVLFILAFAGVALLATPRAGRNVQPHQTNKQYVLETDIVLQKRKA